MPPRRQVPAAGAADGVDAGGAARAGEAPSRVSLFGWGTVALVVATLLAYSNSLRSPFVFDDGLNIVHNPIVHDLSLFAAPWRVDESVAPLALVYQFRSRYLAVLTLAVNYRIHGADVFGYHLVNLAIHVAAALTLFAATRRLLELHAFDASRVRGREYAIALLAAGLFALHPLQTQAVTYIVQRMASLAGLLCLVGFWAYLRARTSSHAAERRWFALVYGSALVAAVATKQNAITFPIVIVLVEMFIFRSDGRARARWLAFPIAFLVVMPLLGWLVLRSTTSDLRQINDEVLGEDIGAREFRLTQIPVLATYLRLTVLPVGQNLDHDFPAARSPFEPRVLACGALLAALVLAGVWLLAGRGGRDPAWRLVGLGILWFFVMHAAESSGVGRIDFIFEHRMYLPSAGLFLAAVIAVAIATPPRAVPVALSLVAACALVLGGATWARNQVWRSELRLYQDVVAKSPRKVRALLGLGERMMQARRADQAERLFLRAHELEPRKVEALVQLGVMARVKRDAARAQRYFDQAVAIAPDHWVALVNLGDLALERGDRQEAERCYRRAAATEELSAIARGRLERLPVASGERESADAPSLREAAGSR